MNFYFTCFLYVFRDYGHRFSFIYNRFIFYHSFIIVFVNRKNLFLYSYPVHLCFTRKYRITTAVFISLSFCRPFWIL